MDYAKQSLGVAARIGKPTGFGGVAENIDTPQFAAAVGLMLTDSEAGVQPIKRGGGGNFKAGASFKEATGIVSRFLDRFKA